MKILKIIFLRIRLLFASSEKKSELFRKHYGVKIGSNARFTGLPNWSSEPYLIEIGNDVTITQNVVFHTHDGGVGVFRKKYPGINVFGRIKIGNNVFIGSNTIFLPGVTIGDNIVIGAGSIVTRDIPSNSVAVGVPAKVIKTIEQYEQESLGKAIYVHESDPEKRKKIILNELCK